jgi:hypothetical protein
MRTGAIEQNPERLIQFADVQPCKEDSPALEWSEVISFLVASGAICGYESHREKDLVHSLPDLWGQAGRKM